MSKYKKIIRIEIPNIGKVSGSPTTLAKIHKKLRIKKKLSALCDPYCNGEIGDKQR